MNRAILLIDDDAAVLSLLGSFFEQRDWLVMRATDTAGAAVLYERERPDVVVLDLELPGMSGLLERAVLRAAGADEVLESHLPVEISAGPSATGVAGGGLALEAVERAHIAEMLAQHGGNRTRTARSLGISRATLYAKLARYGLGEIGWSRPIRPSDPSK